MRCVQINDAGVVVSAILWGEEGLPPNDEGSSWLASDEAQPGWTRVKGKLVPPPAVVTPEPVPAEISPRQLLIGLAAKGWITPEEALAAATAGTPPAVIEGVFASLPADQQLAARITWARMTTVLRTDALVPLLAATKGQSEADVDAFFRTYAVV